MCEQCIRYIMSQKAKENGKSVPTYVMLEMDNDRKAFALIWGTLILKNTKLGCAAQTKPSLHAFIFVRNV